MALSIKDIPEIIQDLNAELVIQNAPLTDDNTGSILNVVKRAVAASIADGWLGILNLYTAFFVSTASDSDQDLRGAEIGMQRNQGSFASGYMTVRTSSTILIPQGTLFYQVGNQSLIFIVTQSTNVIAPWGYVPIQAFSVGYSFNLTAGTQLTTVTLNQYPNQLFNVGSSYSGTSFTGNLTGGINRESRDQFSTRYADYITNLQRGTMGALRSKLAEIPGIGRFLIESAKPGPGWITVNLLDYNNNVIPSSLSSAIKVFMDEYAAAGMAYRLRTALTSPVDVTIIAYCTDTTIAPAQIQADIGAKVSAYFSNLDIGEHLYLSNLIAAADSSNQYVSNIELVTPTQNITAATNTLIVPGTISIQVRYA